MKPYIDYKILVRSWDDYRPKSDPETEANLTVRVHTGEDGRVARKTAMEHATKWLQENAPRGVSRFIFIKSFIPGATE